MAAGSDADEDGRPDGEVEPADDAEDQGEAEAQERVGVAQHHPVHQGLDDFHHAQSAGERGRPGARGSATLKVERFAETVLDPVEVFSA